MKAAVPEGVETNTAAPSVCEHSIHMSLQGKGGVGKSLIASILAQYLRHHNHSVECIDTDPVNRTFSQYKSLNASRLELLRNGNIDPRGFDALMERLLTEDATFVIDNGASTFLPLWSYVIENRVMDLLKSAGKKLYVHTVVTGGQALLDTINGFRSLAQSTEDRNIVLWANEYFGRIERDGKRLAEMAAYVENAAKVVGSVHITQRNHDTFGRDVEEVIAKKLSFEEAIRDGEFSLMTKQRLKVVQRDLFEPLASIGI
jgi:cellulose biosynthesis protein BcsQ